VLSQRIKLALAQMKASSQTKSLSYDLPNGMRVEYPSTDQGMYISAILTSVFEYDKFIRRMVIGLARRDLRQAMEIFLDFCTSGHISESEIMQIRYSEGKRPLPYHIVTRVLLRQNRRFYDGNESYLKNLFQCNPADPRPDHLLRIALLRWLRDMSRVPGPTAVRGYHPRSDLVRALVPLGHDADVVRRESLYFLKAGCIVAEHQSTEELADEDLVALAPSGFVHIDILTNIDYIAACSEDTWFNDIHAAKRIAERIGSRGAEGHYQRSTTVSNSSEIAGYLKALEAESFRHPEVYLDAETTISLHCLEEIYGVVEAAKEEHGQGRAWQGVNTRYPVGRIFEGTIDSVNKFGVFVELEKGVRGLISQHTLSNMALPGSLKLVK
jgi:hypothetical protein